MRKLVTLAAIATLGFLSNQSRAAESASAQLSLLSTTAGPTYNYAISVNDTGTTTIGTFWFAWKPGQNYLPSLPSATTNPTNWGNSITPGSTYAIEWQATPGDEIQPGGTLTGFGFSSTDSPAVLGGNASAFPSTPILTTTVYSGQAFSDGGAAVVVSNVPEPATISGIVLGISTMLLRRPKRSAE